MEQRNYEKDLPAAPPEGLVPWLKEKGYLGKHLLIYRADRLTNPLTGMREKAVKLTCSACGGTQWAAYAPMGGCDRYAPAPFGFFHPELNETIISRAQTLCPMCGKEVRAAHIGDTRVDWTEEEIWPMTVHRVGDRLALIGWCVRELISHEGKETISVLPYEGYVVEEKKVIRLMGYVRCMSSIRFFGRLEQRKACVDNWGSTELMFPWDKEMLEGTTAEHSKLDLYMKAAKIPRPVTYLRLWQRHRDIENLVVQGAGRLLSEMIDREMTRYSYEPARGLPKMEDIQWKERRPAQMLGLTREEFRHCLDMKWDAAALRLYRNAKAAGVQMKLPEDLTLCLGIKNVSWCEKMLDEGKPLVPLARYLRRQMERDKRTDPYMLDDYWRMAQAVGYDLNDRHVRLPKDLKQAHDRVMDERRRQQETERRERDKRENQELAEVFQKLYEKLEPYSWEDGGILIRPCREPEELEQEGKTLNHCVGSYKKTHAEGNRVIFFVRRADKPEEPWFTLQLDMKTKQVLQNRGKCNCKRTKAVGVFEERWIKHILGMKLKKTKKRGNAA